MFWQEKGWKLRITRVSDLKQTKFIHTQGSDAKKGSLLINALKTPFASTPG